MERRLYIFFLIVLGVQAQINPIPGVLPPPLPSNIPTNPEEDATNLLNSRTQAVTNQVQSTFSFCIVDGNKDRDLAFKFDSQNSQFITDCTNGGSLVSRLCGEEEIRHYFKSITKQNLFSPNVNCNLTNWSLGCEPGWASSLSPTRSVSDIPLRSLNPQPCCEGFFCPRALTCMIPCPLGAYCPLAKFDSDTGVCKPYGYQMTPNISSSCGGADKWADIDSAGEVFCPPGSYCPSPAVSSTCDKGHFCREGTTSQSKCYKFTSCPQKSDHQNLQVYGIFFIAVLALLLVLIYSCSGQVMLFRDRRKSKKREKAINQARVEASAFEKWGMPPQLIKKVTKELSRTFSRKRVKNSEEIVELSNVTKSDDPAFVEIQHMGRKKPSLKAPPIAFAAVHSQPPGRHSDTESQIFKYAFNEIEKEKVSHYHNHVTETVTATSKRPAIELAFEDLTMVLKKSGKKILSNVTGKLFPGHITAIMGPSGAGKTTFLNAVAGKTASECQTTGRVYINGQQGSIRAYRKIIGFVPQDDIVHGSLTVAENLVFSAKYRLAVDIPKRERVLIVERIISSLGLNAIRDSLVGTVEKRGISGGQRKRVNVGLEMVMEPSLLILDEPTSGLDSTSSRLVLQALRREALAGVNVVVVLHQPSYGLFQMFDNVMFLAKGGRTVYLGPVPEVESYFSSLGVNVPGRINPPDMYMDLLEGAIKPEGNPSFDPSVLPLVWIQREGLKIPDDLKEAAMALETKFRVKKPNNLDKAKTLREEAWNELKEPVVEWWDGLKHALFTVEDISGRKQPGFFRQFRLIFERVAKQRFRESRLVAQDYIILFLAGICVGLLSNMQDKSLGTGGYTYSIIALSLLCMISALRTFSADKLQFWRESASGINRMAFFLAKDTVDHFNTVIKPLFYLSMFYFFNNPRSTFVSNYTITMAFIYCVQGIAYVFAILMQPSTAQLCCVFFPVVSTLIATRTGATGFLKVLGQASYARWALEAYVVTNAQKYNGVWLITRCGILQKLGYDLGNFNFCIGILIGYGIGARVLALVSLFFSNRKKQK